MAKPELAAAGAQPDKKKSRFDILQVLLVAMIVYIPNAAQFKVEFAIKGLNIINLLFLATLFVLHRRNIHAKTPPPLKGPFYFIYFILVMSFLIGVASDASEWVDDLTALKNMVFFTLFYFLYYRAVQDMKTLRLLFGTLLFVVFFASFLGLRQALDYGIGAYNESRRVAAPFGWGISNANRSAIFFVIFLPLFAAVALFWRESAKVRMVALACLGLGVFVLFFTYSRQSYFIMAVLALLLTLRKNIVIALVIGIALLNFEAWAPESAVERIMSTKQEEPATPKPGDENAGEGKYDESTESRFVIWSGAGQLIADRPWGIGLNHFKREIGTYAPRYAGMDAHNNYVLIATEAGLLGPPALVIMLFALLALGWRTQRLNGTSEAKVLGIGFTAAVLAVIMGNIYGSRFFDGDVMGNFWVLAALVARYGSLLKEEKLAPSGSVARPKVAKRSMYA